MRQSAPAGLRGLPTRHPLLRRNILANYAGSGVLVLAPLLALPGYLAALGPAQFGLVSFVVLLQSILGLMDAGLGQALVREFALRVRPQGGPAVEAATLLRAVERVYWGFALLAGALTALLAEPIARFWLQLGPQSAADGVIAVVGAVLLFVVQFPGSLYRSLLIATEAQVRLNVVTIACSVYRHAGGVAVVSVWPTLTAYLAWHAGAALLETMLRAVFAWRCLGVARNAVIWDPAALAAVWRMCLALSGATLLGALTVQMDRIVLSRMTDLEQFGFYSIAATVAVGVMQLVGPLVQAFLPRAIQARGDPSRLAALYLSLFRLVAILVAVGALAYAMIGERLVGLWLRDAAAAERVAPVLAVLLVGSALNAFYNIGYMHWLVQGLPRRILAVNLSALLLSVTLVPLFVRNFGVIGAAVGWLVINFLGFALSLGWVRILHARQRA